VVLLQFKLGQLLHDLLLLGCQLQSLLFGLLLLLCKCVTLLIKLLALFGQSCFSLGNCCLLTSCLLCQTITQLLQLGCLRIQFLSLPLKFLLQSEGFVLNRTGFCQTTFGQPLPLFKQQSV